jgi:hypothetical protein
MTRALQKRERHSEEQRDSCTLAQRMLYDVMEANEWNISQLAQKAEGIFDRPALSKMLNKGYFPKSRRGRQLADKEPRYTNLARALGMNIEDFIEAVLEIQLGRSPCQLRQRIRATRDRILHSILRGKPEFRAIIKFCKIWEALEAAQSLEEYEMTEGKIYDFIEEFSPYEFKEILEIENNMRVARQHILQQVKKKKKKTSTKRRNREEAQDSC